MLILDREVPCILTVGLYRQDCCFFANGTAMLILNREFP